MRHLFNRLRRWLLRHRSLIGSGMGATLARTVHEVHTVREEHVGPTRQEGHRLPPKEGPVSFMVAHCKKFAGRMCCCGRGFVQVTVALHGCCSMVVSARHTISTTSVNHIIRESLMAVNSVRLCVSWCEHLRQWSFQRRIVCAARAVQRGTHVPECTRTHKEPSQLSRRRLVFPLCLHRRVRCLCVAKSQRFLVQCLQPCGRVLVGTCLVPSVASLPFAQKQIRTISGGFWN